MLFLEITIRLLYAHFPFVRCSQELRFNKIYNFVALSTAKSAFPSFFLYWARTVAGKKKRERLLVQLGATPWFLFGCQQSYLLLLCVISANINQVKMAKNNSVVLSTPFLPCRSPGRVLETPKDLWTRPGDWIRADTWIQMKELEKLYLLFLFLNDFLMQLSLKGSLNSLTNILWKNWKPIPWAALFALLPAKEVGREGRIKNCKAQGSVTAMWSHPSSVSWWAHTVLGPQRQRVMGTRGPQSAYPTKSR